MMVDEVRNLDVAQKASMDVLSLNNLVVSMRKFVKKAKGQCIQKLSRMIKQLRSKKGSEEQVSQNNKKADRLHEEIALIKGLPVDKVSKFALQNTTRWEDIVKQAGAQLQTKVLVRLSDTKDIQAVVVKFRKDHDDWRQLAAFIVQKNTGRRMKRKKKSDGDKSNVHGNQEENRREELESESRREGVSTAQELKCNVGRVACDLGEEPSEDEDDGSVRDAGFFERNAMNIGGSDSDNSCDGDSENCDSDDAEQICLKPNDDENRHLSTNKEMVVRKINLNDFDDEDMITSSEIVDSLQEVSDESKEDLKKQTDVKKRSSLFLGVDESSDEGSSENEEHSRIDRTQSHARGQRGGFRARGRGRGRGRGGRPVNQQSDKGNPPKFETKEKLHPSWEASKKRKQQRTIQAFQGKKIKFDDD